MACFADIIVSQGSVATYARCGGISNINLTANLGLPVNFLDWLRFERNMAMSLWPRFFGPLCSRPGGREMKWGFFFVKKWKM